MSEWICGRTSPGTILSFEDIGRDRDYRVYLGLDDDEDEDEEFSFNDPILNRIFFGDVPSSVNECLFCKKFANCHTDGHRCAAYEPR